MDWKPVFVALFSTVSAAYAASQEVRAKELYYSGGAAEPVASKSKPSPGIPAKAGPRVPARNLGLKCSIQLMNASGEWTWVSPERPFYSGDRVRIHVESNTSGRLTIMQKQDDGTPELLFPTPELPNSEDPVEAGRDVMIQLRFDEDPGKIRLFILLTTEKKGTAGTAASEDSKTLLGRAETVTRSKGLRIDVDNSSSQPATFTVRPASSELQEDVVATGMTLDHRARPARRNRP